jgi:hypothetical protein
MKFYKKRLNSLEELRREKKALNKAVKQSRNEVLHPLSGGKDDTKAKTTDEGDDGIAGKLGDIMSLATGFISSNPLVSTFLLPIVQKYALKAGKSVGKAGAGIGFKIAKELLGGYLKWKAIELGVKGASKLVKNQTEKKKRKQAEEK